VSWEEIVMDAAKCELPDVIVSDVFVQGLGGHVFGSNSPRPSPDMLILPVSARVQFAMASAAGDPALKDNIEKRFLRANDRSEAVAALFASLVTAPREHACLLRDTLLQTAKPEQVLRVALRAYERHGTEVWLSTAAALLREMGVRAWPCLRALAESGRPECELFVEAIAACDGVPAQEKLAALTDLARNADPNVRRRVLELVADYEPATSARLLQILAAGPADDITEEAQERLASSAA